MNRRPLFTKIKPSADILSILGNEKSPYSKTTSPGLLQEEFRKGVQTNISKMRKSMPG